MPESPQYLDHKHRRQPAHDLDAEALERHLVGRHGAEIRGLLASHAAVQLAKWHAEHHHEPTTRAKS